MMKTMTNPKNFMPVLTLAIIRSVTLVRTLDFETYNPQSAALFPTSATLVIDPFIPSRNCILFDAEFTLPDGEKLVKMIQKSGCYLEYIVITCGDPDYYFGLQAIVKHYPEVKIVSTKRIVDHIIQTKDAKLAHYAPQLKSSAPSKLYVPEISNDTKFYMDYQPIELRRKDNYAAFFFLPCQKVIFGGVSTSWGVHVFTADTQTPASRASWRAVLQEMIDLQPANVIPGHYLGDPPPKHQAIKFTLEYLENFEKVLQENDYKNSTAVIEAMKEKYPDLGLESSLELGAKVNTGEMQFSK